MFVDLARSHQYLQNLLDRDFFDQLGIYHRRLISLRRETLPTDVLDYLAKLHNGYTEIAQYWFKTKQELNQKIEEIEKKLIDLSIEKKINSRAHWVRRLRCNYDFYHNHRNLPLDADDHEHMKLQMFKYLPGGYCPVALIGLDHRVPTIMENLAFYGNPFYLADIYDQSFEMSFRWKDAARRRIIHVCLGMEDNEIGLHHALPEKQFGLIVIWNLFNYFTTEVMQEWLEQTAKLLRPGGKVFITYNNCLDPTNAHNVELGRNGFVIPSQLKQFAANVGLNLVEFDSIQTTHWAVFAKPGEFSSVRVTPGTGLIMTKN